MTAAHAATLLGIEVPRITGKSQVDVEAQLAAWKEGPLKKAWRVKALQCHPDTSILDEGAEARFRAVVEAYAFLRQLRVRLRRATQEGVDPLVASLMKAGILERNIRALRESGELERLRAEGPTALPEQVRLLQQRQRLGLFGQHAGWPR